MMSVDARLAVLITLAAMGGFFLTAAMDRVSQLDIEATSLNVTCPVRL